MRVKEVSLVDRAANKRRFLLTKRGAEMANDQKPTELTPDGKGGFTTPPQEPVAPAPVEKNDPPPTADPAVTATNADPAPAPEPEKTDAEKREEEIVAKLKAANVSDDLIAEVVAFTKAPMPPADGKKKPPFPGAAPPFQPDGQPPAKKDGNDDPEDVEKVGAKMRKDRLARLQALAKEITSLVTELSPPEPTPSAGASVTKNDDEPVPVASEPSAEVTDLQKQVSDLTAKVTEQDALIEKLAGVPAPSAQIPVETLDEPVSPQGVSWPLDLNNPVDREHVAKDVSFHDV
jgi:hypothetical protein